MLERPVPNLLELALDYANAGLWEEAADLLAARVDQPGAVRNPLPAYLYAYVLDRMERRGETLRWLREAASRPPALVFPFELEFIDILEWAIKENPADARAPYYLGNLLFDIQPERAIGCWEKARALDPGFALVHRNLGLAYGQVRNDLPAAVASLEKAVALNPKDARAYYELDQFYEAAGTDPDRRLSLLEANQSLIAGNDNALAREVGLLVRTGRPERALEILRSHHFHVWEGGGEIHGLWIEANLALGRRKLGQKEVRGGLASFLSALNYPANLDVGPPSSGAGSPKVFFHIGQAQKALGRAAEAAASFRKAAARRTGMNEQAYYAASALAALGRTAEARLRFVDLACRAQDALSSAPAVDFFEKFGERRSARTRLANLHFLVGLGLKGRGLEGEAKAEFAEALALDPGHLDVRRFLGQ